MAYYKKPKDVRYVDMAMWIDDIAYKDELTIEQKNTMFEYLYHLISMLAYKANYFRTTRDYEDFAIFMASRMYFRITNPKQFELNDAGEPKLQPIRSCLNYIKSTIDANRVDYQQIYYAQTISEEEQEFDRFYSLEEQLEQTLSDLTYVDFEVYFTTLEKTIKEFLKRIPYYGNKAQWHNIYFSCLLTFLNEITIKDVSYDNASKENIKYIDRVFERQAKDSIILWHLDDNMKDYIQVLVKQLKHLIASELSILLHTQVTLDSNLTLLAMSEINHEDYYEGAGNGE